MAKAPSADPEMIRRATEFIFHLREHYRAYHDHKESMAYTGATLYVVAFGSALVMKDWPPPWGSATLILTILAITIAWLGMLVYLKWKLRRRRWAALRVAGAERLLAKWITELPTEEDLATWVPQPAEQICTVVKLVDYMWPIRSAVLVVDQSQAVYPHALVDYWMMQASGQGTEALIHERLVISVGWIIYGALLVRTVLVSGSGP